MRLHLILAFITVLLLVVTLRSRERHHFTFEKVQAIAEQQAKIPYVPLPDVVPPPTIDTLLMVP